MSARAALMAVIAVWGTWLIRAANAQDFITNPTWIERPDGQTFARHYPQAAMEQSVVGRATLECDVVADGRLRCAVASEVPAGWGFGQAAQGIATAFRLGPDEDGRSREGQRVRVPIRFTMRGGGPVREEELPADIPAELRALLLGAEPDVSPIWEAAPSYETVQNAYPADARRRGIRGRGVLSCAVNNDRGLSCEGVRETPVGHGFLNAALSLADDFRLADMPDAPMPAGPIVLPINFGAPQIDTPLSRFYSGLEPFELPSPAPIVTAALYPVQARNAGIEGSASVVCTLAVRGVPEACTLEHETPAGHGFGEAVLAWARQVPISAGDLGLIAGDQVRLRASFASAPLQ
jgi:hypothetical protein